VDACPAGSGPDTITLAPGATYPLTSPVSTLNGGIGLPDITSPITILGNGATVVRVGEEGYR
jgi:hypothetical protein